MNTQIKDVKIRNGLMWAIRILAVLATVTTPILYWYVDPVIGLFVGFLMIGLALIVLTIVLEANQMNEGMVMIIVDVQVQRALKRFQEDETARRLPTVNTPQPE